jgi:hypothetical protein
MHGHFNLNGDDREIQSLEDAAIKPASQEPKSSPKAHRETCLTFLPFIVHDASRLIPKFSRF